MHQANGDTRLCTACIDHVDLVAVGRAVLRETGTKDLKLGGRGEEDHLPSLLAFYTGFPLPRATVALSRRAQMYEPNEIEERERERGRESGTGLRDPCSREYVARIQATTRFPVYTWRLYVYARVFFQRDLLPNS